jgi:hypothetical protein
MEGRTTEVVSRSQWGEFMEKNLRRKKICIMDNIYLMQCQRL